jgi:negative regulator of genetic competence, sporulation and motility
MNDVIVQNNELVHIAINGQANSDVSRREMGLEILKQLLDDDYPDSNLTTKQNKYGDTIDITIQFQNIEDATQFKLTYMLANGI